MASASVKKVKGAIANGEKCGAFKTRTERQRLERHSRNSRKKARVSFIVFLFFCAKRDEFATGREGIRNRPAQAIDIYTYIIHIIKGMGFNRPPSVFTLTIQVSAAYLLLICPCCRYQLQWSGNILMLGPKSSISRRLSVVCSHPVLHCYCHRGNMYHFIICLARFTKTRAHWLLALTHHLCCHHVLRFLICLVIKVSA